MALKRKPLDNHPDFQRALELHRGARVQEAEVLYRQLLQRFPKHPQVLAHLGLIALQRGQLDQCIGLLEQSLAMQPNQPEVLSNLANAIQYQGRLREAVSLYDRALTLLPAFPHAWSNKGKALLELGQVEESLACCDKAIALDPQFPDAHGNRGNALKELGCLQDALQSYDRALELNPNHTEARFNKAVVYLLLGEFDLGWKLYEWRWTCSVYADRRRYFAQPQWLGEPISGKTVLLHAEQGFGDTIQFCRYATKVVALGARVILECPGPLMGLMHSLSPAVTLVETGAPLPAFDLQCPLMSLPLAFRTGLTSIPVTQSYLAAPETNQGVWRSRLGSGSRLRVGLAWSGSTGHVNDINRSMALASLSAILRKPAEFHSLQVAYRPEDLEELSRAAVIDHAAELTDFSDTAALMSQLDLVISVDTAVAHLAGALGKPVWLMLPFMPDYRWMMQRDDSPWYPAMRLFRQVRRQDWTTVVETIAENLELRIKAS